MQCSLCDGTGVDGMDTGTCDPQPCTECGGSGIQPETFARRNHATETPHPLSDNERALAVTLQDIRTLAIRAMAEGYENQEAWRKLHELAGRAGEEFITVIDEDHIVNQTP